MDTDSQISNSNKWIISLHSFIFFVFLASPFGVKIVNSITRLFGLNISTKKGYMNQYGLIVQGTLVLLLTRLAIERHGKQYDDCLF